jgi:hypothetical protein
MAERAMIQTGGAGAAETPSRGPNSAARLAPAAKSGVRLALAGHGGAPALLSIDAKNLWSTAWNLYSKSL